MEDVISSIIASGLASKRVDIFYDALKDKLPKEYKNNSFNIELGKFLKRLKVNITVKAYLSVGDSRELATLHTKGISVADYIASTKLLVLRNKDVKPEFLNILDEIYVKANLRENWIYL